MQNNKNILVLSPHTDDGELGCGATIAKFLDIGYVVYYATFTYSEESVLPNYPKNILEHEVKKATQALGILPENLLIFRYQVRRFSYFRQEILEDLVRINNEIKPDLVFLPCQKDLHQDHSTISNEGIRAFKKTSILGYELPWNNLTFSTQCFSTVSEVHINKKIQALECYKSQSHRDYLNAEYIRGLAITRGTQIGKRYAEAFEVIRLIL